MEITQEIYFSRFDCELQFASKASNCRRHQHEVGKTNLFFNCLMNENLNCIRLCFNSAVCACFPMGLRCLFDISLNKDSSSARTNKRNKGVNTFERLLLAQWIQSERV